MESNFNKKAIRSQLLKIRGGLTPEEVKTCSEAIVHNILTSKEFSKAKTIMGFLAFKNETLIDLVLQQAILGDKIVCVPYIYGDGLMKACKITSLDNIEIGEFGIRRPKAPFNFVEETEIDLVLTPGVGFTTSGERIGMGKGFYDRFLAKTKNSVIVGVAYERQIVPKLPLEATDYIMSYLVTEKGFRSCKKK